MSQIFKDGHYVTLVGGTVRDYFLKRPFYPDLDIEIRSEIIQSQKEWCDYFVSLHERLIERIDARPYRLTFIKKYLVVKIASENETDYSVDLLSPRVEVFQEGEKSHDNFRPLFTPSLPYDKAFARRDFTINALGIEIRSWEDLRFVDPFGGLQDLQEKVLRPCGDHFAKDPVRLVRAVRFLTLLDFSPSAKLGHILKESSIEGLTLFYFLSEAKKSHDLQCFWKLWEKYFYDSELALLMEMKIIGCVLQESLYKKNANVFNDYLENYDPLHSWEGRVLILVSMVAPQIAVKEFEKIIHLLGEKKKVYLKFHTFFNLLYQIQDTKKLLKKKIEDIPSSIRDLQKNMFWKSYYGLYGLTMQSVVNKFFVNLLANVDPEKESLLKSLVSQEKRKVDKRKIDEFRKWLVRSFLG